MVMTLTDNWRTADKWQKGMRDRFLLPFYQRRAYEGRVVFFDKGRCATLIQKRFEVDTAFQSTQYTMECFEEKIVQKPHDRFFLEVESCTVPGHESDGWMRYGESDILFFCFQHTNNNGQPVYLDAYMMKFPPLKTWFWEQLPSAGWEEHIMLRNNRTKGYKVPISEVVQQFPDTLRFVIADNGLYRQTSPIESDIDIVYRKLLDDPESTIDF